MSPQKRQASFSRTTTETDIQFHLVLDGAGENRIATGIGFLDHMLAQMSRHGLIDLTVAARGDLAIDDHHTVEDVGIALGRALREALGDGAGIVRYGHAIVPMDEALVLCAVDVSGRGLSVCDLNLPVERLGTMATEMIPEFVRALAHNAGFTLHLRQLAGENGHHIAEAAFKALGRGIGMAVAQSERVSGIPSTKGVL